MDIILQGLTLLVAGMTIVYLFLTLLVCVMNQTAKIVIKFNHILPDDEPKKKTRPVRTQKTDDADIAVVIIGAIAHASL